jgi:DNA primase
MRFSDRFVDEVRGRLSLPDIIGRRVKLIRSGHSLKGCCPFHQEKTPSFHVYEKDGHYHCFGCEAHGDAIDFVRLTENLSFAETIERLAQSVGLELPRETPTETEDTQKRTRLRAAMEAACSFFEGELRGSNGWRARSYLAKRALQEDTWQRFRLGYAPSHQELLPFLHKKGFTPAELQEAGLSVVGQSGEHRGRFRDRVMFPILDRQGRVIAFGGRLLGPGEPKYLNSPETPLFHKGHELYAQSEAAKSRSSTDDLLVCEGYMDVIALLQAGFKKAVAPLGTALTPQQLESLWRLSPEPVLCFDGDAAGQKAALRALERALPLLVPGKSLNFCLLPKGEDPASLLERGDGDALKKALSLKKPLLEMLWSMMTDKAGDVSTPERRAKWEKEIFETITPIKDETLKGHYRRFLQDKLFHHFRPQRKGKGPVKAAVSTAPLSTLRANAAWLRARALLVTFLNHPLLLQDEADFFLTLTFPSAGAEAIRLHLLDALHEEKKLDADALNAHLKDKGLEEALDAILQPDIYTHAPFAKRTTLASDVTDGWHGLLESRHLLEEGIPEVRAWQTSLSKNMTPDVWTKVQRLRTSMDEHYQQLGQSTEKERMEKQG